MDEKCTANMANVLNDIEELRKRVAIRMALYDNAAACNRAGSYSRGYAHGCSLSLEMVGEELAELLSKYRKEV